MVGCLILVKVPGFIVEKAGGLPDDTGKIINGGPMMGKAVSSLDIPIVKGKD